VATDKKNEVLGALGRAGTQIRDRLGESLASVQKYDTPLDDVTTSSLEALQAYSLGSKAGMVGDVSAARAFFERATSLDPNFAMAHAMLGMMDAGATAM
jgi:eukaryotic-like serine/threonine-protein kinase